MNAFPREMEAWKNDVARRLVRLRGTFNNLMMLTPQIPDPEIGMPCTGPLSPSPFEWPTRPDRSGGTNTGGTPNTGGTSTAGGCPGANKMRILSYTVTGTCGDAGTYTELCFFSGVVSPGGGITYCQWLGASHQLRYYTAGTGLVGRFAYLWNGGSFPTWYKVTLPPNVGATVSLPFVAPANTCTYPANITVRGEL